MQNWDAALGCVHICGVALKDYPDTLLNNRHTDLYHTGSGHSLFQTGEHTQTNTQTYGHNQVHYLPASLSYAVEKN